MTVFNTLMKSVWELVITESRFLLGKYIKTFKMDLPNQLYCSRTVKEVKIQVLSFGLLVEGSHEEHGQISFGC